MSCDLGERWVRVVRWEGWGREVDLRDLGLRGI